MWSWKGRIRVLHQTIKLQLTVTTFFEGKLRGQIDRKQVDSVPLLPWERERERGIKREKERGRERKRERDRERERDKEREREREREKEG